MCLEFGFGDEAFVDERTRDAPRFAPIFSISCLVSGRGERDRASSGREARACLPGSGDVNTACEWEVSFLGAETESSLGSRGLHGVAVEGRLQRLVKVGKVFPANRLFKHLHLFLGFLHSDCQSGVGR